MVSFERLLTETSRTFALAIPLLPDALRRQVTLAYLVFRIADTLEDATAWSAVERVRALANYSRLLRTPDADLADDLSRQWSADPPVEHVGYRRLLAAMPNVLAAVDELGPTANIIRSHAGRTSDGMAEFAQTGHQISDLTDFRQYCYVVAGIVGELLTDLFLADHSAPLAATRLRALAPRFGEGLQLVNILKDVADDVADGRWLLPPDVSPDFVFHLAEDDLRDAGDYVAVLRQGSFPSGVVQFCALPVELARATLTRLRERGPGARLTRPEVAAIAQGVLADCTV